MSWWTSETDNAKRQSNATKYAADKAYQGVVNTNAANMDIAQMNIDAARQQWLDELEYNKPVNQFDRYRDAGINPYMALGQISAGNAESLSDSLPQIGEQQNPYGSEWTSLQMQAAQERAQGLQRSFDRKLAIANQMQGISSFFADIADGNLKNEQARNLSIQNDYLANEYRDKSASTREKTRGERLKNDLFEYSLPSLKEMPVLEFQQAQQDLQHSAKMAELEEEKATYNNELASLQLQWEKTYGEELRKTQIDEIKEHIRLMEKQGKLADSQAAEAYASAELKKVLGKKANLDYEILASTASTLVKQVRIDYALSTLEYAMGKNALADYVGKTGFEKATLKYFTNPSHAILQPFSEFSKILGQTGVGAAGFAKYLK